MRETWENIVKNAKGKNQSYKTAKKLLGDNRFGKIENSYEFL